MYSDEETKPWLLVHIPFRVMAAITGLDICDEWAASEEPLDFPAGIRAASLHDASSLGRLAAIRWLIEFIGIQEVNDRTRGLIPRPSRAAKAVLTNTVFEDFGLGMLAGGTFFPPEHEDAVLLARTWKACADATSHPMRKETESDVSAATLSAAMKIIIRHLDTTVYARAKLTVRQAVSMQVEAQFRQA